MSTFPEQLQYLVQYAKINTRSDEQSQTIPTTPGQTTLLKLLQQQLIDLQLQNVHFSDGSFLFATLPGNTETDQPKIGLIAHVDTADFNAHNVQPQIHPNYQGQTIKLNEQTELNPEQFPHLKNYIGETLITTAGNTLLGADDKAGIAEIMALLVYLQQHPNVKHGDLKIAFGPDEEIGRGADHFNVADFDADYAYTLDTGALGEINDETFNAAKAEVHIKGTSVHPSTGKGKLVSAIQLATDFDRQIPRSEQPDQTDGRQGFYFATDWRATPASAQIDYIIRDFDSDNFAARKQHLLEIAHQLNRSFAKPRVLVEFTDQYFNMKKLINDEIVKKAAQAIQKVGIKPHIVPFRGGTDGSKITFKGLPTPNLTNGSENAHGQYEFTSVESLQMVTKILLNLVKVD